MSVLTSSVRLIQSFNLSIRIAGVDILNNAFWILTHIFR